MFYMYMGCGVHDMVSVCEGEKEGERGKGEKEKGERERERREGERECLQGILLRSRKRGGK